MKTSFYFVIWIVIYPILGLFHNPALNSNAFIVALLVVWGLSRLINRSMPQTLRYEYALRRYSILEEAYSGRRDAIHRRLRRQSIVEFVSAVYFGVTFIFVLFSIFRNSDVNDWIALVLFGLFAYGAISRASSLNEAARLAATDSPDSNVALALHKAYGLDFDGYSRQREGTSFEGLLPPRPAHFTAFRIFSLIVAIICTILGIIYLVVSLIGLLSDGSTMSVTASIMYFLYGSLATYFGLRDAFSIS